MNRIAPLLAFSVIAIFGSCRKERTLQGVAIPQPVDSVVNWPGLHQLVYKVNVYRPSDSGVILVSPYNGTTVDKGELMIFDTRGRLLQHKKVNGAAFCFRRWTINGETRYTYIVNDVNTPHIPGQTQLTGYAVIADASLNEIKRVKLLSYDDIQAGPHTVGLDIHDFILLSDNHYYTMAYYPKKVNNIPASLNPHPNVSVVAPVIQEVKNDVVVWQWDGTDYPEFYAAAEERNNYADSVVAQDYMHINSMMIDPKDGNLICSFRNTDQILKIDAKTGKVVWQLGGKTSDFPLSSTQKFYRQHDATLIDNNSTLLLFDNGVVPTRAYSRVLEFKLNEAGRTITEFRSFNIPQPFAQFMGSVQKVNGNYFIGGGTGNYVLEINPLTGERVIEFLGDRATYRAYRY